MFSIRHLLFDNRRRVPCETLMSFMRRNFKYLLMYTTQEEISSSSPSSFSVSVSVSLFFLFLSDVFRLLIWLLKRLILLVSLSYKHFLLNIFRGCRVVTEYMDY